MNLITIKGLKLKFALGELPQRGVRKRSKPVSGLAVEHKIRQDFANTLRTANKHKVSVLKIAALNSVTEGFPLAGTAKILAQEILRFARHENICVKEIAVCAPERAAFKIFQKTIEGYIYHVQDDLGLGPYATVDIIIELKEGIILIERSNPPYGWALPGGFVDYGESLEQAAAREAKEETNLRLIHLRQFHVYSDPKRDPRFHTVSTVFIAKGKGTPKSGDDAKGLQVVKYADLLKLGYSFDHKQIINDYLAKKSLYVNTVFNTKESSFP